MIPVTALSGYLYCPRKLFLEYVLRLVPIPKEVLVRGSIKHETYDGINKVEESIVKGITKKVTFGEIISKYRNEYSRLLREAISKNKADLEKVGMSMSDAFRDSWPLFLEEAEFRAQNIHEIIEEKKVFGDELWEILPKIKSEFKLESEKLQLRGIVDKIEFKDDLIIPFELKTGKAPKEGVWPGHKIQIAAYTLMLEEAFNTQIKEGFIHYLDTKDMRKIIMNPFLKIEIMVLRNKVLEVLSSKTPPPICKNKNKCSACGLREDCFNGELINEKLQGLS